MKLDQTQKAWVSKLVYQKVKYNETYYEVLDHVITALEENENENITFHQKLNQIWNDDFGGYENLPVLERQREKEVYKWIAKKQWQLIISNFKFPQIIGTILFGVFFYTLGNSFGRNVLIVSVFFIGIAPLLLHYFYYFRLKKYSLIKPYIKDKKLERVSGIALSILNLFIFIPPLFNNFQISTSITKAPVLVIIFFGVLFALYFLSYFTLYRETFKMELAKK
jgi:hypothetical protein